MARPREKEAKPDEAQSAEVTAADLPSLDLIYPLAMESFEITRQRMITQDARINRIMTLSFSITGAIPVVYQIFGVSPRLPFLALALVFFLFNLALLIIATMRSQLRVQSISNLHDYYLRVPEFKTKVAMIKYAGDLEEKNSKYMNTRHRLITCAAVSLALEVLALVASGIWR